MTIYHEGRVHMSDSDTKASTSRKIRSIYSDWTIFYLFLNLLYSCCVIHLLSVQPTYAPPSLFRHNWKRSPSEVKWYWATSFPACNTTYIDFLCLNFILAWFISSSSLSRIHWNSSVDRFSRVRSSMKAHMGGKIWFLALSTPLPYSLADLNIISITVANRIGEIEHPMGLPTSSLCHPVV